jgi:hypothetical protein
MSSNSLKLATIKNPRNLVLQLEDSEWIQVEDIEISAFRPRHMVKRMNPRIAFAPFPARIGGLIHRLSVLNKWGSRWGALHGNLSIRLSGCPRGDNKDLRLSTDYNGDWSS